MVTIKVLTLSHYDESLGLPSYQTEQAAGMDIKVSLEDRGEIVLAPFERALIPTGLKLEIPIGYEVQVRPRSGLSLKTPLLVVNSPGTIDSDYRGEVKILIGNISDKPFVIEHGLRIAQLVVAPVVQLPLELAVTLSHTERGEGGFGSTGLN